MSEQARKWVLLGLLVVVILAVGGRRLGGWLSERAGTSGLGFPRASGLDFESLGAVEVTALDLERLDAPPSDLTFGRDPWRYGPPPAPPPVVVPPRLVLQPAAPAPVVVPPVETAPVPQPPAIDVEFLGSFGPPRRRIAVLADQAAVYNAVVGDVVKDKFQVHEIGLESIDLTFVGFPDVPPARLAIGG